jgi:hypothetical protein
MCHDIFCNDLPEARARRDRRGRGQEHSVLGLGSFSLIDILVGGRISALYRAKKRLRKLKG